jgi:hypothetical protein
MRTVTAAFVLALCACSAASTETTDDSSEDLSGGRALRFDFASITQQEDCPTSSPPDANGHRRCFDQKMFDALNYKKPHFLVMGSDKHKGEIDRAGNALAVNINDLGAGWDPKSHTGHGATAADEAWKWAVGEFPSGVPEWFFLNEISTSQWQLDGAAGDRYRHYVVEYVKRLAIGHQRKVVVFSPFPAPVHHEQEWKELATHAHISPEVQMPGSHVSADPGMPRQMLEKTIRAFEAFGIPKSRLFICDNFANTAPGAPFGRDGAKLEEWERAMDLREEAVHALGFGGYVSYAWGGNDGETAEDKRVKWIERYAEHTLP